MPHMTNKTHSRWFVREVNGKNKLSFKDTIFANMLLTINSKTMEYLQVLP